MNHSNYDMNIGNELAQIIKCHTLDDVERFCKNHNLRCDTASVGKNGFRFVFATYNNEEIGITIQIKRLHNE